MLSCASVNRSLLLLMMTELLLAGQRWPAARTLAVAAAVESAENDTAVVGSLVRLTKTMPPTAPAPAPAADSLGAGSKALVDDFFNGDKFAKQGFERSRRTKDGDGYARHDTFHTKDGDGFGYAQHAQFEKKGGGAKFGAFGEEEDDDGDGDAAAGSSMPEFSQWNFERKSGSPAKSYRYEGGGGGGAAGKLVGPDYAQSKASRRSKRKKEPQPSATEYDNYEYADVEEADEPAPADFEADEGEPEYGALYADADAYDYY